MHIQDKHKTKWLKKVKIMVKDKLGISSEKKKSRVRILRCELKENIESTNDINC